ncbi:hypothetical protein F5883DRAFT_557474 [Diaporthe sp. PMI_573]|nr:hypothetical protein F5883DRAFT_557474 [Diaporthaceae sp. PMI_573]
MGLSFARVYSRPSLFSSLLVQVQAQVQVQYSEPSQYRQHICLHHGTVPPLVFLMRPRTNTQTRFALEENRTSVANLFVLMGHLLCSSYSRTWGVGSFSKPKGPESLSWQPWSLGYPSVPSPLH